MRSAARSCLVLVLVCGLLDIPAMAASEKPLGFVIQAESAHLDKVNAVQGATVYPGDAFDTEEGGVLRLKLGASQIYLLSRSAATLAQNANIAHVDVFRGTVGFATPAAGGIELETPLGIVRAAKSTPVLGQLTIKGPQELIISSYEGTLLIEREGEEHAIEAGKSYDVTLAPEAQPASADGDGTKARRHHLKMAAIIIGAMGITGYVLWQVLSESPWEPSD
jgi:hypothetical protein